MKLEFTNQFKRSWAAIVVGVVGAGVSIYNGIKQRNDAKKKLAALDNKDVPQALLDNQTIATQQANQGLPSEQYAMAMKNIDRQNSFALTRSNSRRGGLGLIPYIQQSSDDAYGKLDAANAAARLQGQNRLMGVNSQIAGIKNQKYQADYNYAMSLEGAGNQNINNGIDSGLAAAGKGASAYGKSRSSRGLYGSSSGGNAWGSSYGYGNSGDE